MNKIRPEIEHSYDETTNPPKEIIFADDSDFPILSKAEQEFLKSIMKETLAEDDSIVNEDKTEETIINQLKDKNDKEWRKTKKLGCLFGCYEDMKRRIQLSYAAFNTIKKIQYQQKIYIDKKLQLYKSTVKPILFYNSGTWGLTKKEQLRQLRTLINNKKICNNKLHEKCKEEEISVTIERNKQKLFGHILRLQLNAPANEPMKYYFKVPEKIK